MRRVFRASEPDSEPLGPGLRSCRAEVLVLKRLNDHDPQDKKHCIRLFRTFEYRNHLCMAFECMWDNLRLAIKKSTEPALGTGDGLDWMIGIQDSTRQPHPAWVVGF